MNIKPKTPNKSFIFASLHAYFFGLTSTVTRRTIAAVTTIVNDHTGTFARATLVPTANKFDIFQLA
jgi:hypothetical protein